MSFEATALPPDLPDVFRWPGPPPLSLHRGDDGWFFSERDDLVFWTDPQATTVRGPFERSGAEVLVRRILPRLLTLRGRCVIHGSAVASPAGAVVIAGPSGAGKSTLAAWLQHDLGWPVLADDAVVLDLEGEQPVLHPTSPRIRLWEDSAAALAAGVAAAEPLARYGSKFDCRLQGDAKIGAQRLRMILLLGTESHQVSGLPASHKAMQLAQYLVRFNPAAIDAPERRLALAARLASSLPIQVLCLPRGLDQLPVAARTAQRLAQTEPVA